MPGVAGDGAATVGTPAGGSAVTGPSATIALTGEASGLDSVDGIADSTGFSGAAVGLDFKIFFAAFITVEIRGLRDLDCGLGAGLGIGFRGGGTEAATSGGGTAWAIPADLGSRSRVFFLAGVDAVFDFITEKPLYRYADLTAGTRD